MSLALAMSVLLTLPSAARDDLITPDPGTKGFRTVLALAGLSPLRQFNDLDIEPHKKVVIIFGDIAEARPQFWNGRLQQFLGRGGALLLATDRATESETAAALGVWVQGRLLEETEISRRYRGVGECPFLEKPSAGVDKLQPPLDLGRVATNRPSLLGMQRDRSLMFVADLPKSCRHSEHGLPIGREQSPIHFAIAGKLGPGRFMVIADHSLFINTMLLQPDNDNFAFAWATINWLTENGKRTQALFLDDGVVRTSFELFPSRIDDRLPHPDVLMPAIDHMIIGLEDDHAIDKAIGRFASPSQILRVFLLVLTVGVAAWGLYRVTAGRLRLSASTERLPERVETLADPASASERRLRDRAQGDVVTLAQELARQFFDENGVESGVAGEQPQAVASSMLARRYWRRKVTWLWSVAQGDRSSPWPPERLPGLVRDIEAARTAIASGQLQVRIVEHTT